MEKVMKNNIQNEIDKSFLPFTEEELKKLNFTEEELNILEDASAYAETADILPDNPDTFVNKLDKEFPSEDPNKVFEKLAELAKKDSNFVNQILAVIELTGSARDDVAANPQVEKVSLGEINKLNAEVRDAEVKKLANELIDAFKALSPKERKEVMEKFTKK